MLLANKHKPWIEAEYQGIVMENDNTVLLNPPLFALDKDAPLRYAGMWLAGELIGFSLAAFKYIHSQSLSVACESTCSNALRQSLNHSLQTWMYGSMYQVEAKQKCYDEACVKSFTIVA